MNEPLSHVRRVESCKLNLGAGSRGLPDWTNVDAGLKYRLWRLIPLFQIASQIGLMNIETLGWLKDTARPSPNLKRWNLRRRLPLQSDSVAFVYCAETLEHFEFYAARTLLHEIYRVLKPGGILRISTPDARRIAKAYIEGAIDSGQFNRFFYEPLISFYEPSVIERIGKRIYTTQYHLWIFDTGSLNDLLREVHFSLVEEPGVGLGKFPDLDRLEHFTPEELARDRGFSMYVEATK